MVRGAGESCSPSLVAELPYRRSRGPALHPLFLAVKQRPGLRALASADEKLICLVKNSCKGHSRGEPASDGQLVAPLDAPVLLLLDPRDGSGRLLGGNFIPVERKFLAAETSQGTSVWALHPSGSAKRERAEHGWAGKDTISRKKKKTKPQKTHRGKILQETVKNFQANINPAFSSSHLATKSRERVLRANVVNGAQILYHTAHARS